MPVDLLYVPFISTGRIAHADNGNPATSVDTGSSKMSKE